jgi:hypothetical protein
MKQQHISFAVPAAASASSSYDMDMSEGGGKNYKKYLKYKNKYLQLKNKKL